MKTKKCGKCLKTKKTTDFNKNNGKKDGLQPFCSECNRSYQREHYKLRKKYYGDKRNDRSKELKEWFTSEIRSKTSCKNCGFNNPLALDFHHRNPKEKVDNVSSMVYNGFSKKKILAEIEKCEVLCANCHRIHHSECNHE